MQFKKIGKNLLCALLERQVKQLLKQNKVYVIVVGGSVGKTSTKLAIASTLSGWTEVIYQDGNYNDRLTVPLVFFGQTEPSILNVFAWAKILLANQQALKQPYPYKYAVIEIGTDGPGQLADFAYLEPDLYVLTAIADEHMEYFRTIDNVAKEELVPANFSKLTLVNIDNAASKYLEGLDYLSYSSHSPADYIVQKLDQKLEITLKGNPLPLTIETKLLGQQGAMISLAAASVNHILGKSPGIIQQSLQQLTPVAGRMQQLNGLKGSLIIDDTYNASPLATRAALDVLYSYKAGSRIALLGSMNELGQTSAAAHASIGKYCDPKKLTLVVTIGSEAKKYLAPAAKKAGCQVVSFLSPYEAGNYLASLVEKDMVILAKGSQNGVFAEEAVKLLLADKNDSEKLVRQSRYWLNVKSKQFPAT